MLSSLSGDLDEEAESAPHPPPALTAANQRHLTSVLVLLATMRDIHVVRAPLPRLPTNATHAALTQSPDAHAPHRAHYPAFCKEVLDVLTRYPTVCNHSRLAGSESMAWLRSLAEDVAH